MTEISKVVQDDPSSSKAILIKAEIFYEMGLFEQVGCDWSAGGNTHFLLVEQAMVQHYRGMKISPRFENNVFPSQIE